MSIKDLPESEYNKFVDALIAETSREIIEANGHIDGIKTAIWRYVDLGYSSGLTSEEIIDFFCVSSDSVVDKIPNQSKEDRELVVYVFDRVNSAIFPKYYPETAG